MKKLSIKMFDIAKIGEDVNLRMISGGATFKQTGSGTNDSGSTYRDFATDAGSHILPSGQSGCGTPDDATPSGLKTPTKDGW